MKINNVVNNKINSLKKSKHEFITRKKELSDALNQGVKIANRTSHIYNLNKIKTSINKIRIILDKLHKNLSVDDIPALGFIFGLIIPIPLGFLVGVSLGYILKKIVNILKKN